MKPVMMAFLVLGLGVFIVTKISVISYLLLLFLIVMISIILSPKKPKDGNT